MIVPKLLAKHEDQHNTGEKYGCLLRSFKIEIGTALPPTIRLLPTRTYSGSPIGTTYSVSVFPLYDDHKVNIKIIYWTSFSLRSSFWQEPEDKLEIIHMVFWVRETFPPVISIRPIMSLSKSNIFSGKSVTVIQINEYVINNLTLSFLKKSVWVLTSKACF